MTAGQRIFLTRKDLYDCQRIIQQAESFIIFHIIEPTPAGGAQLSCLT
jgi:hypothetical protein